MKKFLISVLFASIFAVSAFAIDLGDFPTGSWVDEKWDAEWEIAVKAITLKDNSTGKTIFTFDDNSVSDFKVSASTDGVTLTFSCAETHRAYKFRKPLSVATSLEMTIDPDWTATDYKVDIPFKKLNRQ
jgi:hypothetical protein